MYICISNVRSIHGFHKPLSTRSSSRSTSPESAMILYRTVKGKGQNMLPLPISIECQLTNTPRMGLRGPYRGEIDSASTCSAVDISIESCIASEATTHLQTPSPGTSDPLVLAWY